jgi:hypothetical protein
MSIAPGSKESWTQPASADYKNRRVLVKKITLSYLSLAAATLLVVLAPFNARAAAGDLYESDYGTGYIFEFTPDGTRSTFASGLNGPLGLAFNSAGNLFEADQGTGRIYEFTPGGTRSTFASGLNSPTFLAFQPVPEGSILGLLAVGALGLGLVWVRRMVKA